MNQYDMRAEIVRQEEVAPRIFRLTFRAPEIAAAARPGQFVMVRVSEGLDPLLRRPFSIHQATAGGEVQILYKILGKGTDLLAAMPPGRRLALLGPLGRGYDLRNGNAFCLLGGGMGIAPLFFLARELLRRVEIPPLQVLLGARTAAELAPLARDFADLGVQDLHLATDDGSLGHHGSVVALLPGRQPGADSWSVCTCGPHPMMKAVAAACLDRGWRCQVSLETMMACGISACLGCAVPAADAAGDYLHACKDGPVFEATEVAWG